MSDASNSIIKLLWVEDQARKGALLNCTQIIEKDESYNLTTVAYASVAEEYILSKQYDKIIFDIRILPGYDSYWEEQHNALNLRLGIKLIERVFKKLDTEKIPYGIISIEDWSNLKDSILSIDSKFNSSIQYRRKGEFVFPNKIIPFINNLRISI